MVDTVENGDADEVLDDVTDFVPTRLRNAVLVFNGLGLTKLVGRVVLVCVVVLVDVLDCVELCVGTIPSMRAWGSIPHCVDISFGGCGDAIEIINANKVNNRMRFSLPK
jgi:hypothetical protein